MIPIKIEITTIKDFHNIPKEPQWARWTTSKVGVVLHRLIMWLQGALQKNLEKDCKIRTYKAIEAQQYMIK